MKCLNKSLPIIKEALSVVGSEPVLARMLEGTGDNVTIDQVREIIRQSGVASVASKETIKKVKEVAIKMGVSFENLSEYAKASDMDITSVSGLADLTRGVIAVASGVEDVAITEEMVHVATAILEQTNPTMVTDMLAKVGQFKIYKQTYDEYKDNKYYQLPNGKPDIRKIKKEAVDKLIAEVIVNGNQNTDQFPELREEVNQSLIRNWWQKLLDFLGFKYKEANISVFEKAAATILNEDIGTTADIKEGGVYLQQSDEQKGIAQKIQDTKAVISRVTDNSKVDPILSDTEEASNWYELKNADGTVTRILKRVTDKVKAWYKRKFGDKQFTEKEKAFNEMKREYGIQGHADFENIVNRYFDSATGQKRDKALPRPDKFNTNNEKVYSMLEDYVVQLINNLPEGTAFFPEVIVYDKKNKEAGTIDLLAVQPDGTAHIFDWKFMQIKGNDVAWFKQGAFDVQLGTYKEILKSDYGVKKFGKIRAVPIVMDFALTGQGDNKKWEMSKLEIGSVNTEGMTDLRLLPVSHSSESTGFQELDDLISSLNGLLSQIGKDKASTEEEREFKIERLNTLRKAIRLLQGTLDVVPLINTIEVMRKEGETLIHDYEAIYKDKKPSKDDFKDANLSDFSENLVNYIALADLFGRVDDLVGKLIYSKEMDQGAKTEEAKKVLQERKDTLAKLSSEAREIRLSGKEIEKISRTFVEKHVGERNLVAGFLSPERVVKGLAATFRGVSELPTKSLEILYRLTRSAQGKASTDALDEIQGLMAIREKIVKRGGDTRKFISKIFQHDDKGKFVNKLIHQYDAQFYEQFKEQGEEGGSRQWVIDNVNVEEYQKEAKELIESKVAQVKKNHYPGTTSEVEELRERIIEDIKKQYDFSREDFSGWNNYVLKRHPQDKWFSKEFIELRQPQNAEALELFNFIRKYNEKANDIGYITAVVEKTFLPFVRKSLAEKVLLDGRLNVVDNFLNSLEVKADDVGYGAYNEVTKELEYALPKYYTSDFTKKADGVNDYSEVSEDIFKNMILYIQQVEKYKYMSEIEGQLNLVKTMEGFKNHLTTTTGGDVVWENGKPKEALGNEDNLKTYDEFMRTVFYGQKYVLSDSDTDLGIGKAVNAIKKTINKIAGKEILKPSEGDTMTSMVKTIDAANRAFQMKTLGLEFISGAVNWFGGNIQVAVQAGNYFTSGEFTANETRLMGQVFASEDEKTAFVELMNTFMPLAESPSQHEYNKAGLHTITNANLGNMLMVFMRKPEQLIEKSIFLSLLDNMMVENGRIVSIREYVKAQHTDRYANSATYRSSKTAIDKEVDELKKTRSISATKKVVDGKLVIPGLSLDNKTEIQRLTNLTRKLSRNATGSLSDDDVNRMSMSIWTRSMMVFHNWIPKLTDTRFSEFRKVGDDFSVTIDDQSNVQGTKYDIGRIRLLGYVLNSFIAPRVADLVNILNMNDKGILVLDKMYEDFARKYEEKSGEKLNMSREEFIDMIHNNLRNQMRELALLASMVGLMLAMGYMVPDDDTDKAGKNFYRYAQKTVDKFVSELSFFYNPLNYEQLLSGGMFPAMGIVTDFMRFVQHLFMESTGMDLSNPTLSYDEVIKKAHPIKYLAKSLPVTKSVITYLSLIDSEFATDQAITVQKSSQLR